MSLSLGWKTSFQCNVSFGSGVKYLVRLTARHIARQDLRIFFDKISEIAKLVSHHNIFTGFFLHVMVGTTPQDCE